MSEPAGGPLVSVVVPTRDRADRLARCLQALEQQTVFAASEIVVVDDGSIDASAVRAAVSACARARLVRQPAAGPAAARNTGVRAARGEYVCFTDDDCEPRPDWVERLLGSLRDGVAATAGFTVNGYPENVFAEASELVGAALTRAAPNHRPGISFARSNNLACRRVVLTDVPFDEGFPIAAGEDREWCARLLAAGHILASEPSAVVVHRQQLRFGDFWRQQVRYGRGSHRFRSLRPDPSLEPPAFYAGLLARGFRTGMRVGLLVLLAQLATAVGVVAEWGASHRTSGVRTRRPPSSEMPSSSGRNGGQADEMVDDVEWEAGDHTGGSTLLQKETVKGLVEDRDEEEESERGR